MACNHKLLALAAVVAASAFTQAATTFVWDFATAASHDSGSGPFPASRTFLDNNASVQLPVTGWQTTETAPINPVGMDWNPTATAHDLYRKYTSGNPSETGLGLDKAFYGNNQAGSAVYASDHEITPFSFVQLDLKPAKDLGAQNLSFQISSAQSSEGYVLWGGNVAGAPGHYITSGVGTPDVLSYTVDGATFAQYRYFTISGKTRLDWQGYKESGKDDDVLLRNGVTASVPEPTSIAALGLGLVGLARRKKKA